MYLPYQHLRLGPLRALKQCDLLNLGRINVLCGKNNTGKSTLLEAAAGEKTAGVGFSPDEKFVDALIKANNDGLIEHQSKLGTQVTIHLPNEKLENQIAMNVKANNRAIASEMTIEEIADTDFNSFLDRVEVVLQNGV